MGMYDFGILCKEDFTDINLPHENPIAATAYFSALSFFNKKFCNFSYQNNVEDNDNN